MSPESLRDAARRRSSDAVARGRAALAELVSRGERVTFQAVAREAGVSRQWLYTHPELRAEIERVRATRVLHAERASDASLRQRIESLLDENRSLRKDVGELREELALAYGHQRDTRAVARPLDHDG
jgi:hypothetical protein